MLKNREHPFPPNGFLFYQPQTNWWAPAGLTFWQVVDAIIDHRKKNPRFESQWTTDREKVGDELDFFTCLRLPKNARAMYCNEETPATLKKNPTQPLRAWPKVQSRTLPPSGAGAVGARAENFAAGVGVVLDWLGDSLEPVSPELAEKRAGVCAVCPQNGRPDFIQRIEGWAASGVKELMKVKNDLELKTSRDGELHHCQGCDCAIALKIHAPLKHILAHTSERVKTQLDPKCWILHESES